MMDNSFKTLIDSSGEVLILLPEKPSLDQAAAGLSLYLSLLRSGKVATISCSSPMTAEFSRLIGVDKVTNDLGDKNLTIKFVDYNATDVDKVSYDIVDGQFKLTVSQNQVQISNKGTNKYKLRRCICRFIILIGGANESHFQLANPDFSSKIIHIGTRLLEIQNPNLQVLSFARPQVLL
jgi:hypothetical protein